MFWIKFRDLLKRLGLLLLTYMALRLTFLLVNHSVFREAASGQVLKAFLQGLRFDLSAIFMVNALFVFLSLLPGNFTQTKGYQQFLKVVFLVLNFPFLCINLIDLEYFKFIGRRTSNELFTITSDIQAQTGQLILNY